MDEEIKYEYEAHSPIKKKYLPWPYCRYCGLIFLKNKTTKWCINMGCNSRYHPKYKQMLKKLSK